MPAHQYLIPRNRSAVRPNGWSAATAAYELVALLPGAPL